MIFSPDEKDSGITQWYGPAGFLVRGDVIIAFLRVLRDDLSPEGVPPEAVAANTKGSAELEQAANKLVRPLKPDLVILAVPATAAATNDEQFVRSYSWIMNWSLSFGHQEWDCVVVHPSVVTPDAAMPRGDLIRQLVHAQDLPLIDRPKEDRSSAESLFNKAVK